MAPPPPGSLQPPIDPVTAKQLPPNEAPNPAYERLYHAYRDAYGSIDQLRRALDPAGRTLGGTDAWIGPEARGWGGQLDQNRQILQQAAEKILSDIHATLMATSRTIQRV